MMAGPQPACDHSRGIDNCTALGTGHGTQASVPAYEIIIGDGPGPFLTREIRPSTATPDGQLTFATYAEAKRVLLGMLAADITEAREWLQALRYNRTDVRRTRKAEVDRA